MSRDIYCRDDIANTLASLYGLVDTEALIRMGLSFGLKPEDWMPDVYTLTEDNGHDTPNPWRL